VAAPAQRADAPPAAPAAALDPGGEAQPRRTDPEAPTGGDGAHGTQVGARPAPRLVRRAVLRRRTRRQGEYGEPD
jgi:hypothetical protein